MRVRLSIVLACVATLIIVPVIITAVLFSRQVGDISGAYSASLRACVSSYGLTYSYRQGGIDTTYIEFYTATGDFIESGNYGPGALGNPQPLTTLCIPFRTSKGQY